MDNKLFREKSLESLNSPEVLTDYLRVTGPGIWFILAGIISLLTGIIAWGFFGKIITMATVPAIVENGTISCYVLQKDISKSDDEIEILIGDVQMTTDTDSLEEIIVDTSSDERLFTTGYLAYGQKVEIVRAATDLDDGFYEAQIRSETREPARLFLHNNASQDA